MPAINGRRDEYVIASKLRNLRRPDGTPTARGRPEYVKAACERSLRRLRTEFLDLSYIHRVDPTVPIEDTVGAMSELAQDRKVRFLGISEAGPQTVRRAHATHPVSAVQIEYSLWTRDVEAGMLDLCRELGIGFVGYSPLGRGFLTGTVTGRADLEAGDARRRMQPSTCRGVAQARGSRKMHAGAAGARLDSIPRHLDRADRRHQLPALVEENAGASDIKISAATQGALAEIFPPGAAAGARYPEVFGRTLGLRSEVSWHARGKMGLGFSPAPNSPGYRG